MWTDPMSGQKYMMYWQGEAWLIEWITEGTVIIAVLNEDVECPVGNTGMSNWEIQGVPAPPEYLIVELQTIAACNNTTECTEWGVAISIPDPWQYLLFSIGSLPSFAGPGTEIASFSSVNPILLSPLGVTIGALVYQDNSDPTITYTVNGANRSFIGIILIDSFGNYISPTSYGDYEDNSGFICFQNIPVLTTNEINQECFDILVWNKQCEFAQCVLKYLQQLQFGVADCNTLDNLKNQRRALEILNCYDTRDIADNTTIYNMLTYSQIKKLLNS